MKIHGVYLLLRVTNPINTKQELSIVNICVKEQKCLTGNLDQLVANFTGPNKKVLVVGSQTFSSFAWPVVL